MNCQTTKTTEIILRNNSIGCLQKIFRMGEMPKNYTRCLLGIMVLFLMSCNLSDFQTDKLVDPQGLTPVVYRPFASGVYEVKDYAVFPGAGNTPVTMDPINFRLIPYPLNGVLLNTSGTDSMVVIIKTINETPMKYGYTLAFSGTTIDSRAQKKFLAAASINSQGDIMEASTDSLEFKLTATDVKNLGAATQIDLLITLNQPDKGTVLASVLKSSRISFAIGFRARLNLFKVAL